MNESVISDVPGWYHSIEVQPGLVTPGLLDLRTIVDRIPWPDLKGKRCLDVATFDGHLAFEMERRGAAEVVATDLPDFSELDWLPGDAPSNPTVDGVTGQGFKRAKSLLGSNVQRELVSVYDMTPERLGTFDVVTCGALLLHLRDPFRALERIRSVCDGVFVSAEKVDPLTDTLIPAVPVQRLLGTQRVWAEPNVRGHLRMLEIAGFDVEASVRYAIPFGAGAAADRGDANAPLSRRARRRLRETVERVRYGGNGLPISAVRARPRT